MENMIWNPDAWDMESDAILNPNGTIQYQKMGAWVMTIEEAREALDKHSVLAKHL